MLTGGTSDKMTQQFFYFAVSYFRSGTRSYPLGGNSNTATGYGSSSSTQPLSGFGHLHSNYKSVDQCSNPKLIKATLGALIDRLADESATEVSIEFYLGNSTDRAETVAALCRKLASLAAHSSNHVMVVEPKSVADSVAAI
jgi:hypothetical protein